MRPLTPSVIVILTILGGVVAAYSHVTECFDDSKESVDMAVSGGRSRHRDRADGNACWAGRRAFGSRPFCDLHRAHAEQPGNRGGAPRGDRARTFALQPCRFCGVMV